MNSFIANAKTLNALLAISILAFNAFSFAIESLIDKLITLSGAPFVIATYFLLSLITVVINFLSLSNGKSNNLLNFLRSSPYSKLTSNNASSVGSPILIIFPSFSLIVASQQIAK